MYEELVKRLHNRRICIQQSGSLDDFPLLQEAADAIEELASYLMAIDSLPSCNTCMKKGRCEFAPRPGQYCRINCPADALEELQKRVPKTPHGRLIEAEPIVKYVTDGLNSGELGYDAIKVMTEVVYAPTIIPAEEGE